MKKNFITLSIKASLFLLICVSLALTGCERIPQQTAVTDVISAPSRIQAIAIIGPASGSIVTGTVTFTGSGDQITVLIDIQNATPGLHAVHIHETGDCSAPDATSAGGHWNPTDVAHGKWGSDEFPSRRHRQYHGRRGRHRQHRIDDRSLGNRDGFRDRCCRQRHHRPCRRR